VVVEETNEASPSLEEDVSTVRFTKKRGELNEKEGVHGGGQ